MKLLDASNGNLFAVMSNPKFLNLAQKMMANPELMQMMQDPAMVKQVRTPLLPSDLLRCASVLPSLSLLGRGSM